MSFQGFNIECLGQEISRLVVRIDRMYRYLLPFIETTSSIQSHLNVEATRDGQTRTHPETARKMQETDMLGLPIVFQSNQKTLERKGVKAR